jgi:hypothetical protein
MYQTRAIVGAVAMGSVAGEVRFDLVEGACSVGFDVARRSDDWPSWPWLVEGAEVDLSLWDTGGDLRGGDPLWMVIRDSATGAPMMSIYQLTATLIENGEFRNEVGVDANIEGPVCEYSDAEGGLLVHAYDIRFSSLGKAISLASGTEGILPSNDSAFSWRFQTGALQNTFVDPNAGEFDVRRGEYFQFIAWAEPQ